MIRARNALPDHTPLNLNTIPALNVPLDITHRTLDPSFALPVLSGFTHQKKGMIRARNVPPDHIHQLQDTIIALNALLGITNQVQHTILA